ncbi:MAG: hypothetical protein H6818_05150 [Phycisphaerales bacterium]|nr:hypothetical protein [Phycisphaerales bacterium]MCB9863428.1 hypothetical protein [Phycisphaerales bacterium]
MKHLFLIIAAVLFAPISALAEPPVDAALRHVPKDTALIVAIPDLSGFVSGVNAFGKSSHLEELVRLNAADVVGGPLGGHIEGLDLNGAFIVAMRPGQAGPLLIGTLSSPDAWKQSANAEELADGMLKFQLRSQSWYANRIGNVGMIAKDEATVRAAMSADSRFAERMGADARAILSKHEVFIWADIAAWREVLDGAMSIGQGAMQLFSAMTDPEAEGAIAMWRYFFDEARKYVRESEHYAAGMRFSADGAFAQDLLNVRADGEIAGYLAKISKSKRDPLRGLVGEPGMVVFALEWLVPEGTPSLNEAMLDAFGKTMQGRQLLQQEENKKGFDAVKRFYRRLTGYSGSLCKAEGGGIGVTGFYVSQAPDDAMKDFRQAADMWMKPEWMRMMTSQLTMNTAHETTRIGDVEADVYRFTFDSQNAEAKKAIDVMYGESMEFYIAPHKQGVAYAVGKGDFAADALRRLYDPDAKMLADYSRIAIARSRIGPDPQVCMFFDLPKTSRFFMGALKELGEDVPTVLPPKEDAPLIAFGVYLEPAAMRSETFVPAIAIKQMIDACQREHEAVAME